MDKKSFFGDNKWAFVFTLIVLVSGTSAVYARGYFEAGSAKVNPATFREMSLKMLFSGDDPELLAYVPAPRLSAYQTMVGDPVPEEGSMVLGYDEARDMTSENNITISEALWGYTLNDFLGVPVRVSGMLKRTNSLLDMMHILPRDRFEGFGPGEMIYIKLTEDKMPKFFYPIRRDNSNWPAILKFASGSRDNFKSQRVEKTLFSFRAGGIGIQAVQDKTYLPLALGSNEAKMMEDEKLFSDVGDRLDNFFGESVFIAGIMEPTNTTLDMMHYVPAG